MLDITVLDVTRKCALRKSITPSNKVQMRNEYGGTDNTAFYNFYDDVKCY